MAEKHKTSTTLDFRSRFLWLRSRSWTMEEMRCRRFIGFMRRGLTELRFVSGWVWRVQRGFKRTSCKRLSWRLRSSGDVVDDFFGSRRP
ncbi:hypothetical protein F2Q68_00044734 [Brassica cretica]|uniref:Uncharacterized protein n=1 Tax=Brassica cretica TaxID=69181 RepID=A0A8S9LC85_BRACR|nr:hypothetical protein F2Q68_00044734 [Brassica cretica]